MRSSARTFLLLGPLFATACRTPPASRPAGAPSTCAAVTAPFVGTICGPIAGGRHPAVIVLGGWPGGDTMIETARLLGARGYVAASVAYFATPGTQPTLVAVPVEIVGRVLRALQQRSDVDSRRVAIMGSSKGGEYALLAAATYPEIGAVVANVPAPFAWFGLGAGGVPTGCSWSRAGAPLPCVAQDGDAGRELGGQFAQHTPIALRKMYELSLSRADPASVQAAFFPLERIAGPVLCLAGDDDQIWNSRALCELTMSYLRDHHHPRADRMISYPNAGHMFLEARDGPTSALNALPLGSHELQLGGNPEADARAAAAAWHEIDSFLTAAWPG